MRFQFYIDGQQIDEPEGWHDFEEVILRDDENRVLRYDYPTKLTFYGSGHEIIEAKYQEAYNNTCDLLVTERRGNNYAVRLRAIIKLSNCQWRITQVPRRSVEVQIDDTVYQGYIFANQKQPIGTGGRLSIDGGPIAPAPELTLSFFRDSNGSIDFHGRRCRDVKEAMAYIVRAISNGTVGFASEWYDNLPSNEKMCILTGVELRSPGSGNAAPVITLEELFTNLWRKDNLYLVVENPLTAPVLRLENEAWLHNNQVATTIDNVEGLTRELDFDKLYGRINIGGERSIQEFGNLFQLVYIPFLAFAEEIYGVNSPIATEKELNLVSSFIIDHNAIVDALQNNNDRNDAEIFLVQYDASTNVATKGTYLPTTNPNNRFYNERLLNSNVMQRFNLIGDVVLNSGLLGATFLASTTTAITNTALATPNATVTLLNTNFLPCDDDSTPPNFDTGGNYDTTTFDFIAPVAGFYRFRNDFFIREVNKNLPGVFTIEYRLRADFFKNGSPVIVDRVEIANVDNNGNISFFLEQPQGTGGVFQTAAGGTSTGYHRVVRAEQTIYLAAGDVISARALCTVSFPQSATVGFVTVEFRAQFSNPTTPISGGVYKASDPDALYIGMYTAEGIPLSDQQAQAIFDEPRKAIRINTDGNDNRVTYAKQIKRKVIDGIADLELKFNRRQSIK